MSQAQAILGAAKLAAQKTFLSEESAGYASDKMREAKIVEMAIIHLIDAGNNISQAVLAGMWEILSTNDVGLLGEYNTFTEWALGALSPYASNQYIIDLSRIVLRIFTKVHSRHAAGNPFKTEDGTVITVELLLEKPGLIRKLKELSSTFESQEGNDSAQDELMEAIVTKPYSQVRDVADRMSGKNIILIPFVTTSLPDSQFLVTMTLSEQEYFTLRALLGKSGEEHIAA